MIIIYKIRLHFSKGIFSNPHLINSHHTPLFFLVILSLLPNDNIYANTGSFSPSVLIEIVDDIKHSQQIKLKNSLEYVAPDGKRWSVKVDEIVPRYLISDEIRLTRPLPSDLDYVKSALLYLSQSNIGSETWSDTLQILYSALLTEGLQANVAKMLVGIVYVEGWRWERSDSRCYASCHAGSKILRWRPIPDYSKVNVVLDWILHEFPDFDEIKTKLEPLILKKGPHIFAQ